jgi:glyoxylase-like metal-dependent hydrolase (beta-lactamase superfamily II)
MTKASGRTTRISGIVSLDLAGTRVSFVPDGAIQVRARGLFPGSGPGDWSASPGYVDEHGCLTAGHGGLLVECGDRALLIDAGYGPHTAQLPQDSPVFVSMQGGALMAGLQKLGRDPSTIEAVAITHLQVEHIGWASHPAAGSQPEFPNARVLISEPEWSSRQAHIGVTTTMLETLQPRVLTAADGQEVFPGVRAVLLPGHTPGHTGYEITSGETRLLAFGDAMHSAIQVNHPDWTPARESDPELAKHSRRRVIGRLLEPDTIGFGVHFTDVFGRLRESAGWRAWEPAQ